MNMILRCFARVCSTEIFNKICVFICCFFYSTIALAEVRNRSIKSYFVDNVVFQTLYAGGYYTLGIILVLAILCSIFKKFRTLLLSLLMAIFGIFLLIFVYQALEDFEFIPPMY